MKRKNILLPVMAAACSMFVNLAVADEQPQPVSKTSRDYCLDQVKKEGGHCAYLTGLPKEKNNGRYIRVISLDYGFSSGACISEQDSIIYHSGGIGPDNEQYFMCKDAAGTQCELMATDSFQTQAVEGGKSISYPNIFAVDVSRFVDKFPACTSYWVGSSKHRVVELSQ